MAQAAPEYRAAADSVSHHLDVTARARTTVNEAKRYTKFVGVMKRALTIAALVLLGAVLAYTLVPRRTGNVTMTVQNLGNVGNDLAMIKPKLTGVDDDGSPYLVTAEDAVQDSKDTKRAKLRHVEADLNTKSGGWVNIESPRGFLDMRAKKMALDGAVSVFTDSGYEAHTSLANIDLNKHIVVGPHYVFGHGPLGTFVADQFRVEKPKVCDAKKRAASGAAKAFSECVVAGAAADARLSLYGNVRMTIYEKRKPKRE